MMRPLKHLIEKSQDWGSQGLLRLPVFSCRQMKHIPPAGGHKLPAHQPLRESRLLPGLLPTSPLTIVHNQPILPAQAQLLLPPPHDLLHFRRQAVGVAGKHEGVAVSTGAVEVQEAAGVLHSVGVVVRVDDPVVIVCKPETEPVPRAQPAQPAGKLPKLRSQRLPETGFIVLGAGDPREFRQLL